MAEWVRFELADEDGAILVELDPEPGMEERLGRGGDGGVTANVSWEGALAGVRRAATATLRQFRSVADPPDEIEIQFGIKLSAAAGALIAKTGTEGHLDVKVKWQRRAPDADPDPER